MDLKKLQEEQAAWSKHNFGHLKSDYNGPFKGVVEEVGELSHALLKQEQGIRGTFAEHEAKGQDAVADIIVFLADFCTKKGWDMDALVQKTWDEVKQRDWVKYPNDGRTQ